MARPASPPPDAHKSDRRRRRRHPAASSPAAEADGPYSLPHFLKNIDKEDIFHLSLDGDEDMVVTSFDGYIEFVHGLCSKRGLKLNTDSILGRKAFTTPICGTIYCIVHYGNLSAVFVIKADEWWLKGAYIGEEALEFMPTTPEDQYIPRSKLLKYDGNHYKISGGNAAALDIGVTAWRDALINIVTNKERANPLSYGTMVLYLCEAPKIQQVHQGLRRSLKSKAMSRLEHAATDNNRNLLRRYRAMSKSAMGHLFSIECGATPRPLMLIDGIPDSNKIEFLLKTVSMFYVNGLMKEKDLYMPSRPKGGKHLTSWRNTGHDLVSGHKGGRELGSWGKGHKYPRHWLKGGHGMSLLTYYQKYYQKRSFSVTICWDRPLLNKSGIIGKHGRNRAVYCGVLSCTVTDAQRQCWVANRQREDGWLNNQMHQCAPNSPPIHQGGLLMTNEKVGLPEVSFRTPHKGNEEVHVPNMKLRTSGTGKMPHISGSSQQNFAGVNGFRKRGFKAANFLYCAEISVIGNIRPVLESTGSRTARQIDRTNAHILSPTLKNGAVVPVHFHYQNLFLRSNSYLPSPLGQQCSMSNSKQRFQSMNDPCYSRLIAAGGKHQVPRVMHYRMEIKNAWAIRDTALAKNKITNTCQGIHGREGVLLKTIQSPRRFMQLARALPFVRGRTSLIVETGSNLLRNGNNRFTRGMNYQVAALPTQRKMRLLRASLAFFTRGRSR